eukprot:1189242-Prymnesium_polylepis.1
MPALQGGNDEAPDQPDRPERRRHGEGQGQCRWRDGPHADHRVPRQPDRHLCDRARDAGRH